jgi:hypothetical protein
MDRASDDADHFLAIDIIAAHCLERVAWKNRLVLPCPVPFLPQAAVVPIAEDRLLKKCLKSFFNNRALGLFCIGSIRV